MNRLKYYINEIRKNWKNKRWWKSRIMEYFLHPLELFFISGSYVLNEEWDNLIILDACRYDVFEEELRNWDIRGSLEYRISRGSNTGLFLRENFNISNLRGGDIIYITANPWVDKVLRGSNIKVISVWKSEWSEELGTVLPEAVYKKTIEIASKNQNKRIICHFLQPHGPYLKYEGGHYIRLNSSEKWAYKENLRIVMPYVEKLCKILPGKTVVTADHGEAFGERFGFLPIKIYGHPAIRIEPLIKVPWFVTEGEDNSAELEKELIRLKLRGVKLEKI